MSSQSSFESERSQEDNSNSEMISEDSDKYSPKVSGQISEFIVKMYRIMEQKKNKDIVQWVDKGDAFIVKNKVLFQRQLLPKYFKHKKFSSFIRQLHFYNFHKIRKSKDFPMFKHQYFIILSRYFKKGCYDLLHKITTTYFDQRAKRQQNEKSSDENISLKNARSRKSKKQKNAVDEIEALINQNNQLKASIADINKRSIKVEFNKAKKQEKLIKILSALIYFDIKNPINTVEQPYTLRQLSQHFLNEQEPLSFLEYAQKLGYIYREVFDQLKQS